MERYICIHGHFYQPPRENPWLEEIEPQDSAHPYHDWNERISAECYAPNADSRILDDEERIARIVNNYRSISFNFGPTLMSWLSDHDSETYRAILDGDRASRERFSGHGSAIAQAYGHAILPLSNSRDKRTQIVWGIAEFRQRFGRDPEGLWLAETAVDLESLEILAECGIRFTILAPKQAEAMRRIGDPEWQDVRGERIDTRMPYALRLPSGREIQLFFYDGAASNAVAFGGLLARGDEFARRLLDAFPEPDGRPRLLNVATDGETYGHHHRFGDMALAYAIDRIDDDDSVRLTNYGEYLELHPPTHEVRIAERTAWSCAHGLGRWREDCGCSGGTHPGWKQTWRAPLREALDELRDSLADDYARDAARSFRDPWRARDDYVEVVLDRSQETIRRFLERHAPEELDPAGTVRALKLLELQRQSLLMYASCGWFFDEISGVETVQILRHAGRAIQLAEELFGGDREGPFLERLERAPSNLQEFGNGRVLYEKKVRPARVGLDNVAADYAAGLLFDGSDEPVSRGFEVERRELANQRSGRARLATGTLSVRSRTTGEAGDFDFAFLHLGDHNLSGAVRPASRPGAGEAEPGVGAAFANGDLAGVLRILEQDYGGTHSLGDLFRDRQQRILDRILDSTVRDAESVHRRLYDRNAPLMRFLKSVDAPPPHALAATAELTMNSAIRNEFEADLFDVRRQESLFAEARDTGVRLDRVGLGYVAQTSIEALAERVFRGPLEPGELDRLRRGVELIRNEPLETSLRRVENGFYRLLQEAYRQHAETGDTDSAPWTDLFAELGRALRIAGPWDRS